MAPDRLAYLCMPQTSNSIYLECKAERDFNWLDLKIMVKGYRMVLL